MVSASIDLAANSRLVHLLGGLEKLHLDRALNRQFVGFSHQPHELMIGLSYQKLSREVLQGVVVPLQKKVVEVPGEGDPESRRDPPAFGRNASFSFLERIKVHPLAVAHLAGPSIPEHGCTYCTVGRVPRKREGGVGTGERRMVNTESFRCIWCNQQVWPVFGRPDDDLWTVESSPLKPGPEGERTMEDCQDSPDRRHDVVLTSAGIDPAAIATELRIGRTFKENAPTKAMRYLVEGRCIIRYVDDDRVIARVRGHEVYDVEHAPGRGWSCTCPARGRCAHRLAVAHVVARADS